MRISTTFNGCDRMDVTESRVTESRCHPLCCRFYIVFWILFLGIVFLHALIISSLEALPKSPLNTPEHTLECPSRIPWTRRWTGYSSTQVYQDGQFTCYAQPLILVSLIVVNVFDLLIITFQGDEVTTCKCDRIVPLDLLYLPTTTRTRNEGMRRKLVSPEVVKKNTLNLEYSWI